ncbi:MAG: segregation/condensation protein A [Elusimicrobia bacterium]|nr:segregation/condensation protein A [Candidatus Obscuribacterium magneticum]
MKINIFEGPLDLLLHLIQKNDLDIYDISISDITAEYLKYLDILKELNPNVAGEFLVMASTLMQIKARTLLPAEEAESLEGPDPRTELIQKLLEYQKFKEASKFLKEKFETQRDVYYRGAPLFDKEEQILNVSLTELLDAFREVLESAETGVREILVEEMPVEVRIREILELLENQAFATFSELFPKRATHKLLIVTFLALLELIRLRQVRVQQVSNFGEIHISRSATSDVTLVASMS